MGDSAYRGISADQDGRFRNKEQLLLKKLASKGQFPPTFDQKVDMKKVNMEVIRPWIAEKIEELLGFEDDVVVEYVNGMLEDPNDTQIDPKKMQLSLTGFLESKTSIFMSELWSLLLSAQKSIGGIPQEFVDKKKEEMRLARMKDAEAITNSGIVKRQENRLSNNVGRSRYDERSKRSRWDENPRNTNRNRREFVDKSGNRTERVNDNGWKSRREEDYRGPSSLNDERKRRSRSRSPKRNGDKRRGDMGPSRYDEASRNNGKQQYHESDRTTPHHARRRSASPSASPPPKREIAAEQRRDEGSVTPQWRSERNHKRSPSLTPPRRRRDRSPTYSPPGADWQDDPTVKRSNRNRSPELRLHKESGRDDEEKISKKENVLSRSRWAKDD